MPPFKSQKKIDNVNRMWQNVKPCHRRNMFGKNLKKLREQNNLTQENLANSLAVSRQAICMWEKGERTPKVRILAKIAKIFGVSLDHIINGRLTSRNSNSKRDKLEINQ